MIEAHGATDIGRKRQHNEDALLIEEKLGLFIVADGMGGHAAGEIASARAVDTVRQHIEKNRDVFEDLGLDATGGNRAAAASTVEAAIQRACAEIYKLGSTDTTKRGMGTTFVCLVRAGGKGVIGHVGDSRVYLLRAGQCHRLTEDHTLVAAQLRAGTITKDQAANVQYRNVITRAVGIQESVQVDTLIVDLVPGDKFILCSDGLHGYLTDDEIAALVSSTSTRDLPAKFIGLANDRGGRDNITAIVMAVQGSAGVAPNEELAEAESRMDALRKIPLFRHFTYKEQTALLSIASTRIYPQGHQILAEGQASDQLYVLVRGRVTVESRGVEIAELRFGGHFGEMGLVDNAPRSATVRALEPTKVLIISRSDLMDLMRKEPVFAVKMLWSFVQVLSGRLRATNAELSEARQELKVAQSSNPFTDE